MQRREGCKQNCHLGLPECRLWSIWTLVQRVPWEAVLKSKSLGRLCIPQKGTLKVAGVGCHCVLKDEPWGKKNSLAEQRALTRTQGKKGLSHLEEGAASSEGLLGCSDIMQGEN